MFKTFIWVCNLLVNIRHRRPINQVLLSNYGQSTLKKFRKLEKIQLQRDKSLCDLDFLKTCKSNSVFPKFLFFKTSIRNFNNSKLYISILHKCLNFEIRNKTRKSTKLTNEFENNLKQFKECVSWLDYNVSLSRLTRRNKIKINKVKLTHKKKLNALGVLHTGNLDANKVIFNYSSRVLKDEEKEILKLGLQFGFPGKKPKFVDHYLQYEKFIQQISKHKIAESEEINNKIRQLAHEGYNYKPRNNGHTVNIEELDSLKKDKSIIITKPDKGKGVVILNKTEYIEKTIEILNDDTKFKELQGNWFKIILKLEDKLNRLLRSIKNKLPENTFDYLFASGSLPGVLYGLPKIHKLGCPLRPILSALGTFNYNLAKLLVPILCPLTNNDFTIKNSTEFVQDLHTLKVPDSAFLASFDVKSLFTNIPLDETIEICIKECEKQQLTPFNLTKKQFKSLLEIAVKESVFIFGDQLYQQIDGVAMGSPLGPTLANTFLCFHEKNWLNECPIEFKPLIYKRYVDDCFLIFKCKEHSIKFLEYLNKKHKNISFTSELELNNTLPFLDVLITKENNSLTTNVFRKDTYTGLGLNFQSFVPNLFKINSIKTLLHRAYSICSTWISLHEELERLKSYFHSNGYPLALIEKHIKRFINNKLANKRQNNEIEKETKYVTLPFQGHFSYQLRNTLSSLLRKHIPNVNYKFIFVNRNTIGSLFKVKDSVPDFLCSNVVYRFSCPDCQSWYIGSTSRNLKIRISEHRGISYRTNTNITHPSFSKIREHSRKYKHDINEQDFNIVYRAKYTTDLRIAESLMIMKEKPSINGNELATRLMIMS